MKGLKKGNKVINRGITAVAMTVAIATIYAAMPIENNIVVNNGGLRYQIQALLNFNQPGEDITQGSQDSQESLATLLLSTRGSTYSHQ